MATPTRSPSARQSDFALEECPSSSQAGLITVYANYEGNPDNLLGTAPIYDLVPAAGQTALFAFIVPGLDIPINIPVAVRTATTADYGLRFTVSDITQLTPLAGAKMTFWGFPAEATHDAQRFAKGSPGNPAGCAGLANTSCITDTNRSLDLGPSPYRQPDHLHGQPLKTTLEVQTYQDPESPLRCRQQLSGDDRL